MNGLINVPVFNAFFCGNREDPRTANGATLWNVLRILWAAALVLDRPLPESLAGVGGGFLMSADSLDRARVHNADITGSGSTTSTSPCMTIQGRCSWNMLTKKVQSAPGSSS